MRRPPFEDREQENTKARLPVLGPSWPGATDGLQDRQCGSVGDVHPFRRRPEAGAAINVRSESGIRARKEGEIASRGSRGNGFPWSGGRGRKAPDHLELSGFTNPAWDVFGLS